MIKKRLKEHIELIKILEKTNIEKSITKVAKICKMALKNKNKILLCGNGGSAADSQHLAAEIVGRFLKERTGLPAIALTADTSILTAISNDYGYEFIFERQVEALCNNNDVIFGFSTSGSSENIIKALIKAKEKGAVTVGMSGKNGGKLKNICDNLINVPSENTARIQEAHMLIAHIICEMLDE